MKRKGLVLKRLAVAAGALLAPAVALAAGPGIPDNTTTAVSQGGATVAAPDGLAGIYMNPAAIAGREGLNVQLEGRGTNHLVTFQRDGYDAVDSGGKLSMAPFVGISYQLKPFGHPVVIAAGAYGLNGYSGYAYPDPEKVRQAAIASGADAAAAADEVRSYAPQRYSGISSSSVLFMPVLAVATKIHPRISLGATLQVPILSVDQSQAIYAGPSGKEDPSGDIVLKVNAFDMTASGVIGASVELPAGLVAGASVQLPIHFVAPGTLSLNIPDSLKGLATLEGNEATVDITFPLVARAGLRLVRPAFEVELAGTYEAWSQQKTLTLTPKNMTLNGQPLVLPPIDKGLTDAGSVRLGGQWNVGSVSEKLSWLSLRAGALYETSAVPVEYTNLDSAHWERVGLSGGLSATFGRYVIAAGATGFLSSPRTVTNSVIRPVAPLEKGPPAAVGNGTYSSTLVVGGLSVAARFF